MDLFDLGSYFSSYVPLKALSNSLIKCAVCAYAAKHLGRVKDSKAVVASFWTQQAGMEAWSTDVQVDWVLEGAKWYDKAISLLMEALQQEQGDTPSDSGVAECAGKELRFADGSRSGPAAKGPSRLSSDELLTATAILCVYEFLDSSGAGWARHLNGTKSILDITEVGLMPLEMPMTSGSFHSVRQPRKLSRARKAIFWNFARQDALAAFINECQTRLDTEDIQMWREAGLLIDNDGFVLRCNTIPNGEVGMETDMICNALIWIMSKLVNFIAAGDGLHPVPACYRPIDAQRDETPMKIGVSQQRLLERWTDIKLLLKIWFDGLPDIFRPCARIVPSTQTGIPYDSVFPRIWYSIPMCASCMQHYHTAKIVLLINRPHESTARRSNIAERLKSYRSIDAEIMYHCREICGIAIACPESSNRIHQIQPLYVAGQCLTDPRERRVVLDLMRNIEADLGWATEYRVQHLLKEWGWENNEVSYDP
ncbi:hypothetical protein MMC07_000731 [Pseudocyphellaria aurata]|nr:hypothetical protein [Pseudocyphellaria aurata]